MSRFRKCVCALLLSCLTGALFYAIFQGAWSSHWPSRLPSPAALEERSQIPKQRPLLLFLLTEQLMRTCFNFLSFIVLLARVGAR